MRQADRFRLILVILLALTALNLVVATALGSNALGWVSAVTFLAAVAAYVLWRVARHRRL